MKRIELNQGSEQWHAWRRAHVCGTDAAYILGVNRYKNPVQLWEEKVGIKAPSDYTNERMERGTRLEPIAREWACKEIGIEFEPSVIESDEFSFMGGSLDGISLDCKYLLEIKCNGKENHEKALRGELPELHVPQVQHLLATSGLDMLFYVSYDGERGQIVNVYRDQDYINNMIDKEKEFFRCMQQHVPPSFHLDDYVHIEDPRWRSLYTLYAAEKKIAEESKAREEMYKKQLIELAGGSSAKGDGITLSKVIRKGMIDYDTILKQHQIDVDVEQFRKPSIESWRITA